MHPKIYDSIYKEAWAVSRDLREPVNGSFANEFSGPAEWTRSVDFVKPIPKYADLRGIRFMTFKDGTKAYVLKHNLDVIPLSKIDNPKMEDAIRYGLADVLFTPKEQRSRKHPGIDSIRRNPEVSECEEIGKSGMYFVRYNDASGGLYNSLGQQVKTQMENYEFLTGYKYLGTLQGKEHFAFSGVTDWYNRNHPEMYMMDTAGNVEHFKDPRLSEFYSLESMKEAFDKLVAEENDLSNPRRNDEKVIDYSAGKDLEMER